MGSAELQDRNLEENEYKKRYENNSSYFIRFNCGHRKRTVCIWTKKSADFENGLLIVSASAFVAFLCSVAFSPLMGEFDVDTIVGLHWKSVLLSGSGFF